MKNPIYLDANATAPLKETARAAMMDALRHTGNASSIHAFGRDARMTIERARDDVAALVQTMPTQVTFTSGATEANNAVLKQFANRKIIIGATEHPSVLENADGAVRIPVDAQGLINHDEFERIMRAQDEPALLSIMLVNNETGVIQDVAALARIARKIHPHIHIHTDAVQAAGKIKIDFPALQVDYMSISAHKFGGPVGAGALVTAPGATPAILLHGGGQEKRQRAGTENVPAIAGFGAAARAAIADFKDFQKLAVLRDLLESALRTTEPRLHIFGGNAPRVANTSNICLPGIAAETQLMALDLAGIAVSSGSACSSGTVKASHVLQAMGANAHQAGAALRISLGWHTTKDDIDALIDAWQKMHMRVKDRIAA